MIVPGAFRRAVEAKDLAALTSTLAPDVTFHSPVMPKPYQGLDQVTALLRVLLEVFEDFCYTDELIDTAHAGGPGDPAPAGGAPTRALIFRTRVMGKPLQGLDLVEFDDAGRVISLTVMVRPLPAAMTLARAVGRLADGTDPRSA